MRAGRVPRIIALLLVLLAATVSTVIAQPGPRAAGGEVTLSRCWSFPILDGKRLSAHGAHIFVGSSGAKIEALSLDGKKLWGSELGGEIVSNILATNAGIFLVTSVIDAGSGRTVGGTLRLLSRETGITAWTVRLSEADGYVLGLGADLVIAVTGRGTIESFDLKSGAARWRRELAAGFLGEPRFNHANVYAASTTNQVFTLALDNGEIVSVKKLKFAPTALVEITGDVITGDERGNVTSLGKSEKVNWNFRSGGRISTILEVGSNLLAASNDNFVYFFTGRGGGIEWKKRLDNRVTQISVIDDKFALVSGYEEHGAQLIDLDSGKVVGQLTLADNEFVVARPLDSAEALFVLTNEALHAFSTTACTK